MRIRERGICIKKSAGPCLQGHTAVGDFFLAPCTCPSCHYLLHLQVLLASCNCPCHQPRTPDCKFKYPPDPPWAPNLSKIETESVGSVRLKTFAMIYASCVGKKCGSVDLWKLCADKRAHGLFFDADVDIIIFVCAFCCIVLKILEECIVRVGGGRAGTSQNRARIS